MRAMMVSRSMPVQELIISNRMPVASTEIGQGNRILSLSAELGLEQQVGGTMGLTANTVAFSSEREDTRATMEAGADLHLGDFASLFVRSNLTTAFSGADHTLEANAGGAAIILASAHGIGMWKAIQCYSTDGYAVAIFWVLALAMLAPILFVLLGRRVVKWGCKFVVDGARSLEHLMLIKPKDRGQFDAVLHEMETALAAFNVRIEENGGGNPRPA